MVFPKGVSGNPEGRRVENKNHLLRQLCRIDTRRVYEILMDIITNPEEKGIVKVNAIKFHQETAWGKAEQSIDVKFEDVEDTIVARLSAERLNMLVNGKIDDFLRGLYTSGELNGYLNKFKREGISVKSEKEIIDAVAVSAQDGGQQMVKAIGKEELKKRLKRDREKKGEK